MGAIIWQKVTTTNTTGGATIMGSFPYPRNGIVKIDYEFILIFKKLGTPPKPTKEAKELSKLTTNEWNEYFAGHWNFSGERQEKHLAMFPEELPKRLIRMFTFVGDTVLDPFLGSGTTSLAAKNLVRNSVGYEINNEFLPHIERKLGIDSKGLRSDDSEFEITVRGTTAQDFNQRLGKLPYIFKDRVRFDKKIDPKLLNFGSQIDGNQQKRDEYQVVKSVVSPEVIELNSGILIRLIGIRPLEEKREEAEAFLGQLLKGKQVFLKFDDDKHDDQNRLLAYVYLKNKTFVNAHLLKRGFVTLDHSYDHRLQERFRNYSTHQTKT
jgi:site-specific DNA-methyltransferase (adenine-specific)